MTFPSSSTSDFFYTVLFSKRTRFESTRNTRRLGMHRPVMHCFREAIPPAPALRCSAEPRRARFQPSAPSPPPPVTPWESEFAYRKRDPESIHERIQLHDVSFFLLSFFLRKKYYLTGKHTLEKLKFRSLLFVHCFVYAQ